MVQRMRVTCPACGRRAAVEEEAKEALCACGRRFDPRARSTVVDPLLGREIAGFRVEAPLGSGGMGTVYRATQLASGRTVALKALPPEAAEDPGFVARFRREGEILASLEHEGIVRLLDRAESEGRFLLAMEFVDGESLRDRLRRGRLPPGEACALLLAALDALDYAHRRGVLHRDIKPENILLSREGRVKVADFGLSIVLDPGESLRLTRTHAVLGTFEYMAPELREGIRAGDARSDLFSCGVLLYELLTRELPIGRFEPPGRRVPGVDRRLDAVVERALAKDPRSRFGSAAEMAAALRGALPKEPPARPFAEAPCAPPTRFDARLDLLLTLLSIAGMAAAAGGLVLLFGRRPLPSPILSVGPDLAGALTILFGLWLWNAAERARRFWPGARTTLLSLTLLAGVVPWTLPLAFLAWGTLLPRSMRAYYAARHRGLDADAAAAVAQGHRAAPPPRRRAAVRAAILRSLSTVALLGAAVALAAAGAAALQGRAPQVPPLLTHAAWAACLSTALYAMSRQGN